MDQRSICEIQDVRDARKNHKRNSSRYQQVMIYLERILAARETKARINKWYFTKLGFFIQPREHAATKQTTHRMKASSLAYLVKN